jgi:hypothetical protein
VIIVIVALLKFRIFVCYWPGLLILEFKSLCGEKFLDWVIKLLDGTTVENKVKTN